MQQENGEGSGDKLEEGGEDGEEEEEEESEMDVEEDLEMMKALGFSSFGSTKNMNHADTSYSGVFKNKNHTRKYRQYMNRPGGFNKKLDKMP